MKLKIIPSDSDAPEKDVEFVDGDKVPIEPGDTVEFSEDPPVAGVPVGNDLVLFFADNTSVVLEGFFDFGDGEPPRLDLGDGKSFIADYSYQAWDGPAGFLFGEVATPSVLGYEPFGLSAIAAGLLGGFGAALSARIAAAAGVGPGEPGGVGSSAPGSLASDAIGEAIPPPPFECVDGAFVFGAGSGTRTLTECSDSFRISRRDNNTIRSVEGDDYVGASFAADVQYNFLEGGEGGDTLFLVSSGDDGDVEFNTLVGDGAAGMGEDYLTVRAIDVDGDVRLIDFSGGPGNDRISAYGFRDVEESTLNGGDGDDTLVAYAGRVFSLSSADEEMGTAIGLDFGDGNFTFSTINDGIRFNTVDLPDDIVDGVTEPDNISWAVGGDEWVLALDAQDPGEEGFGVISELREFDFTIDNPGTRGIDALRAFDFDPDDPGGPQNGFIDTDDDAFDQFVLWQDRNNDGIGTPDELRTLTEAGVTSIGLGTTGAAYGESDVIVDGVGSFSTAAGDGLLTSFRFRGVAGGEASGREDLQNNAFLAGDGDDTVVARAHQDVQSNTIFGGEGEDNIRMISLIDDLFINEVFGEGGDDTISALAPENNYDNAIVGGTGGDAITMTGDRILRNLVAGGDETDEFKFVVEVDEFGVWTLDTSMVDPVSGTFDGFAGSSFDVEAHVIGTPVMTTETAGAGGGDVILMGTVDIPDFPVRIELDLNQDGDTDVEYETTSGPGGAWTLDTATATPVGGAFTPLDPLQMFDVNAQAIGATSSTTETVGIEGGDVMVGGTVSVGDSTVVVGLDVDQDGIVDVVYEVMSDPGGVWALDTATATPVEGEFTPFSGVRFDVNADVEGATILREGVTDADADVSLDVDGNVSIEGVVELRDALVTVGLDFDQDGTIDVEFEVESDPVSGAWALNTATAFPSQGTFEPVEPGQTFNISSAAFAVDSVIENEVGVAGGGIDVNSDSEGALDIGTVDTVGAASAHPIISGTGVAGTFVTVGLDLVRDGDQADQIRLTATGEANQNEIGGGAGDDEIRVEVTAEPFDRPADGEDPDVVIAVQGGARNNQIRGRSGDDTIEVVVDGPADGAPAGTIAASAFIAAGNTLSGGIGDDGITISVRGEVGEAERNEIDGGAGNDDLLIETTGGDPGVGTAADEAEANDNLLLGGDGENMVRVRAFGNALDNTLKGGEDGDTMEVVSSGDGGVVLRNVLMGYGGGDDIRIESRFGYVYDNTVVAGDGDDTVRVGGGPDWSAQYSLYANMLDGGIGYDTIHILNGGDNGDLSAAGMATNFEVLDVSTEYTENNVFMGIDFFDDLTGFAGVDGTADELTILGDVAVDSVNLMSSWSFVQEVLPSGFFEYSDVATGTRTLFVQGDLIINDAAPPPPAADLAKGELALERTSPAFLFQDSEEELDFDGLGGGGNAAGSGGASGLGMIAEEVLDIAGNDYSGAIAAVELLGDSSNSGAAGVRIPIEGAPGGGSLSEVALSPWEGGSLLIEGEVPPDDGIALV